MPLPNLGRRALEHRGARDHAFETVQRAIADNLLHPGETVDDRQLATELGVHRDAVTEALARLVELGRMRHDGDSYVVS